MTIPHVGMGENAAVEVDEHEAFETLKLNPPATKEQIEAQYHKLAKELHSDKGGNDKDMAKLNEAKRVALASSTTDLALRSAELVRAVAAELVTTAGKREEAQHLVRSIVIRLTSPIRDAQRLEAIAATGLAIATALNAIWGLLTPADTLLGSVLKEMVTSALGVASVMLGGIYWMAKKRADKLAMNIDDVSVALDEKPTIVALLFRVFGSRSAASSWTRDELVDRLCDWSKGALPSGDVQVSQSASRDRSREGPTVEANSFLKSMCNAIGLADFASLIIKKGIAAGLLQERPIMEHDQLIVYYSLKLPVSP
jgi:hypothetical protein